MVRGIALRVRGTALRVRGTAPRVRGTAPKVRGCILPHAIYIPYMWGINSVVILLGSNS